MVGDGSDVDAAEKQEKGVANRWRRERAWRGNRRSEGEEASLFIALVNGARSSQSVRCYTWPAVVGVFGSPTFRRVRAVSCRLLSLTRAFSL